jgi:hypothetical protein
VGGEQHRLAHLGERGDGGAQLAGADRVDADGGLVQEHHRRVVQQPPGDVQALAHAAGVALDPVVVW